MLLAALLLIAPSHCADATLCPSIAEIEQAVRQNDIAEDERLSRDANAAGRHEIILYETSPFRRLSNIRCSRRLGRSNAVTCQATAHYESTTSLHLLRLSRSEKGWALDKGLQLWR